MRYLAGTRELGLSYSPQEEKNFREIYSKIATEGGKDLPDVVGFTDADFAGCTVSLKSTSGSILYLKGTPIAWRSKRQSIRSFSTCESEYVSMFDTIRLSKSAGYLDWFMENREFTIDIFG